MSYFADTVRKHLKTRIERFQADPAAGRKMIFTIPALEESVLLAVAEAITNICLENPKIKLILKIASAVTTKWSKAGTTRARNHGWLSEDRDLTFYRSIPNEDADRLLVIVLCGSDQVTDSASLADFHTCDPDMVWNEDMRKSFRPWIEEKLKSTGHEYRADDLAAVDRVIRPLLTSGTGDLLQISAWLKNLDLGLATDVTDVPRLILGNLQTFDLPVLSRFPLHQKRKQIGPYIRRATEFFNYTIFLEARQRDKALKAINDLQNEIDEGNDPGIPLDDEEVCGPYGSGSKLLVGLRNFIENDARDEREKLQQCDFVVIWDDILKFKTRTQSTRRESTRKLAGSPVEVVLHAVWMTFRDFYIQHKDKTKIFIHSIEISPILFKHDMDGAGEESTVDDGLDGAAENAEYARRYLVRLIGGIDELLADHIEIKNDDGSKIAISSNLLSPEINCRYAKTAEPVLEFAVIISSEHRPFKRKYGWRLPEHHGYRLSINLLRRAGAAMTGLQETHKLPVYHISYFEELLQAVADEEVRRIFLHAIRDERDAGSTLTNLLSGEWDTIADPLSGRLKVLAEKYEQFITAASSNGLLATIFNAGKWKWQDLHKAYAESFEAALALPDMHASSLTGMLTRAFLIVEQRSPSLDNTWHADIHEGSGVATILHPAVVEMLEAQAVYLTRCFNFAVNKELSKTPSRDGFKPHIWRTYVDLADIHSPLTGLLSDESKNLCADVRGNELIHRIGSSSTTDAPLSTRLLLRYNEDGKDESNLDDTEMFRETSESKLLLRLMQDYFDIHPHARDGLSLAVFRNKDIQPVIAAVHAYLKILATKPTQQKSNSRYVLNENRRRPYAVSITFFTESSDESDIFNWIQQWKERWEAAESETKYELYRYCRFSVAHRIVEKNSLSAFQKLITKQFDADIAVFYDFIGAGSSVNDFERVEPFDITSRNLKFPILEKACCTINNPGDKYRRKRIVSNRQFVLGDYHARLLHSLKTGTRQAGTIVVGSGDFSPWRTLIDCLHDKAEWVICIDPNMDERLIRTPELEKKKEREIIGFGSGVGSHGEDNYTISTEQFSLTDIHHRLQAAVQQLYAAEAGWSSTDCNAVAAGVLRVASELSGLSLVRATGVKDQYIRDFMAYALTRKLLRAASEDLLCESLISLDAYRHWFDLADNRSRPDLMWMQVQLRDGRIHVNQHLIECKMGRQSTEYIHKARSQINNGLAVLGSAFQSSTKKSGETRSGEEDRPDRRYWWMQLHRLIAGKTEVSRSKYADVLSALERLAEGDFIVTWDASVFVFPIDQDPEIQHVGSWNADGALDVVAHIYAVGGEFVRRLMTTDSLEHHPVDWAAVNAQQAAIIDQDEGFIPEDTEDDDPPWLDDEDEDEDDSSEEEIFPIVPPLAAEQARAFTAPPAPETEVIKTAAEPSGTMQQTSAVENITTATPTMDKKISAERILLGETLSSGQAVYWEFGHPALANRHMLIFGSSGQGKTYAIQAILCEMSTFRQNSLVIDYTNGFLPNHLEEITNEVLSPKQYVVRQEPFPINPFLPQESDNGGIIIKENSNAVAKRIAGLFNSVYNIGDQQYSVLHQAIMDGVDTLSCAMNLDQMLEILESMAEDKGFKAPAQSLYSKLRPFVLDRPFASGDVDFDWDHLFLKQDPLCHIFQLAGMDMYSARLITEFVLWDLYGHLQSKGKKTDPKVIVLDEVQNLDHQEGSPLSKYLREGRKFGLSLILATQTMSNMKKDERDRMFMAEHKLFFRPADTELKGFAEIAALATRQRVDEWVRRLSTLSKGECYSIGPALDQAGERLVPRALKIRISALETRGFHA